MTAILERLDLVQPILVDRRGAHLDTIVAAARASLVAFLGDAGTGDPDPAWQEWLDGRFTKTVRRTSWSSMSVAAAEGRTQAWCEVGGSSALAFAPSTYRDQSPLVRRAQVAGTNLARVPQVAPAPTGGPVIAVLDTLTTGKAAAQAAHAVWMWAIPLLTDAPETVNTWWFESGGPLDVRLVDAARLAAREPSSDHAVRDAGLTEIEPLTLTALVLTEGANL